MAVLSRGQSRWGLKLTIHHQTAQRLRKNEVIWLFFIPVYWPVLHILHLFLYMFNYFSANPFRLCHWT